MNDTHWELIPSLLVADLNETFEFYELLGFRRSGTDGAADPTWGEVAGHGITIQFYTDAPLGTPTSPTCSGTFYVRTPDVAGLAARLRGIVEFEWGPETMEYGSIELAVKDPNGYLIAFTEPA